MDIETETKKQVLNKNIRTVKPWQYTLDLRKTLLDDCSYFFYHHYGTVFKESEVRSIFLHIYIYNLLYISLYKVNKSDQSKLAPLIRLPTNGHKILITYFAFNTIFDNPHTKIASLFNISHHPRPQPNQTIRLLLFLHVHMFLFVEFCTKACSGCMV